MHSSPRRRLLDESKNTVSNNQTEKEEEQEDDSDSHDVDENDNKKDDDDSTTKNTPWIVLKTASYDMDYNRPHRWEYYRMDASVAAAVTPHPRFVDVYSTCALAMLSEPMPRGDVYKVAIPYV